MFAFLHPCTMFILDNHVAHFYWQDASIPALTTHSLTSEHPPSNFNTLLLKIRVSLLFFANDTLSFQAGWE